MYLILAWVIIRLIMIMYNAINWRVPKFNLPKKRTRYVNGLFANGFIDSKVFYVTKFKAFANISLIKQIDTSKAYSLIMENFKTELKEVYQFNTFDYSENKALFNVTIFVLRNKRIIELGYDYVEIFYTSTQYNWANSLLNDFAKFKVTDRTKVVGFVRSEVMN